MRSALILPLFMLFSSCKESGDMTRSIGLSLEEMGQIPRNIVKEIVGQDNSKNKEQDKKINDLERKNKELNERLNNLSNTVNENKNYLLRLKDDILSNISDIRQELKDQDSMDNYLLDLITDNINNIITINNQLTTLDSNLISGFENIDNNFTDISNNFTDLVESLDNEERIIEVVFPCGYTTGFSEVLFLTSKGTFLAYFEQGGNRYISTLPNGSYRTTDGNNCNFTILNGAVI